MENLDIIILTTVLSTLFLVFIIFIYRELKNVSDVPDYSPESGPRANMIRFIGRMFDEGDKAKTKEQKQEIYKAVTRTISDMESDGVYFSEEVKDLLEQKRKEQYCEYSGLPSVAAYDIKQNI